MTEKRNGHPMFYELLNQMGSLHSRKNHDYAGDKDPLKNLRACERLGINPFLGILVRLQDKWSRIEEFAKSNYLAVKDEAIEDTLMDNAVYSLLAIIVRREQKISSISRVYLDIDGVLAAFNEAACKLLGVEYPPTKWTWYNDVPQGYEWVNNECTIAFWESLDWEPDGLKILNKVEEIWGSDNIYLLSCPMPNTGSWSGKHLWVCSHMPNYASRLIVTPADKATFAAPDALLIDDKDESVDAFKGAGGQAILIPRPWNSARDSKQTPCEAIEAFAYNEICAQPNKQ